MSTQTDRPRFAMGSPELFADPAAARRLLNLIATIAVVDFCLLVVLVYGAITGDHQLTSTLGPIHGVGFLAEVVLAFRGVGEGYWTWRVPALIVVTLGPPGALITHRLMNRTLAEHEA